MPHLMLDEGKIEVTHPDKLMYPGSGFTKRDMLDYYRQIAPYMLPHLEHRPVTVKRYPHGVDGLFFYEKRCPAKHPEFVAISRVASQQHGVIDFCEIDNLQSLLWMANRAAIEFHAYLFHTQAEDRPTMMMFDLDPGAPASMGECIDIALMLRDMLAELGLQCFVKTSGGKGLHLAVPVEKATFASTKQCAHDIARTLARRSPNSITDSMAKDHRVGRVFIDWSQNDHGKTTACAYTLRAQESPTVSAPVSWQELTQARKRGRARLSFTTAETLMRVKKSGDLFAGTLSLRQRLPALSS